jgi:HD superfamily phosphohydrolase YqeK
LKNLLIKDLAALVGIIFFLFIFFGSFLVYSETGSFGFHWSTLKWILGENIHYLLLTIVAMVITIFGIITYYHWALSQRKNCQIQYVELSKIAMKWMEYNEVETTIRERVETEINDASKQIIALDSTPSEISTRLLDLNGSLAKDFVKAHILPFIGKFDSYESKIVFDLLCLLEAEGNITSVASMYENDPEKKTYGDKAVTLSGKTSYQILSEYTLIDHTIRVAKTAAAMHEQSTDIGKGIMYGRVIIAALAHDIGKICVNDTRIRISGEMYHKNPHEHISALIFQELYPDYSNLKMILDAIRTHHIAKAGSIIGELLRNADKKAREIEIGDWLIRNKEATLTQNAIKEEAIEFIPKEKETPPVITTIEEAKPEIKIKPIANLEQKTESKKPSKKHPKTISPSIEFEYDFMEAHGDELIRILNDKVNSTDHSVATGEDKIMAISFGDTVLYDYIFFKKTLEILSKSRLDKNALTSIFTQLRDADFLKMINVEGGFLVSKFVFESASGREEANFVPVSCKAIGLSSEETEESKRQHPKLRSINVQTFNNSNEL